MAENEAKQAETQAQTEAQGSTPVERVSRRQELIGTVYSAKMTKTVVVRVDNRVRHPKYKKTVRHTAKFMAHNELEDINVGDKVRIVSTRPLSAHKRWRVVEVLQKATR